MLEKAKMKGFESTGGIDQELPEVSSINKIRGFPCFSNNTWLYLTFPHPRHFSGERGTTTREVDCKKERVFNTPEVVQDRRQERSRKVRFSRFFFF